MRQKSITFPMILSLLALGMAGCSFAPAIKNVMKAEKQAALELTVNLPRTTQMIQDDITEITATVSVPGFAPVASSHVISSESVKLDLKGLPAGYANVELLALSQTTPIGSGSTHIMLINGVRSFSHITLSLDSSGKTNLLPFSPLMPLSTASITTGRLDAMISGQNQGDYPTISLDKQYIPYSPPYYPPYYGEEPSPDPTPTPVPTPSPCYSSEQSRQSNSQGLIRFANLADGTYRLRYGYDGTTSGASTTVCYAVSDPISVFVGQSLVPTAALNLAWDLTNATPSYNAQLPTRTVEFEWPAKPGVDSPDYYVEIGAFIRNPQYGWEEWKTFANYRTTARKVSYLLPEDASGSLYYRLKYVAGNGTVGGNNYYGYSYCMPFTVPAP